MSHQKNEKSVGLECSECGRIKELTIHGTCWKCHLGHVNLKTHIIARVPSGDRFRDYVPEGHTTSYPDGKSYGPK